MNFGNIRDLGNLPVNLPMNGQGIKPQKEYLRQIQEIIESNPTFLNPPLIANQFLDLLETFLNVEGKPFSIIPMIRIGMVTLTNVSCLELVHRIFYCDIDGFFVHWDNEGVETCTRFVEIINLCLTQIDECIEDPDLTIDEMIAALKCVQESDPFLSNPKQTGRRILNLMEKFYAKNGNPHFYLLNVKIGDERFNKITILELLCLLWRHPHEVEFEEWDDEDPLINGRFNDIVNRGLQIADQMLANNMFKDEDFLPLIRCAIEFTQDLRVDESISHATARRFLFVMDYFVLRKANPNLAFSKIQIGQNVYSSATCFQLTYLVWKCPDMVWDDQLDMKFQKTFNAMLSDRRTDLTARFSEVSLGLHHFVNRQNIEFYRKRHPQPIKNEKIFYTNGMYEPDQRVIDELEGHCIERMTIAHYAVTVNDFVSLTTFLDLEPRLSSITCCMTKGKALLNRDNYKIVSHSGKTLQASLLEDEDTLSGDLKLVSKYPGKEIVKYHIYVRRITQVTLLHLAGRSAHEGVLACLRSKHCNPSATDSDNKTAQYYLQLSVFEGLVKNDRQSQMMWKVLDCVTHYQPQPALPEVNKLFHYEGYDLLYNTGRKVAIFAHQRLGKDSFGEEKRTNHKWQENFMIPDLNRVIDADFKNTGFDRGHLVPAEDATGSEKKMGDTFKLENVVPQNQNLNRGAWKCLEAHVRKLTEQNDLVEVFTGPLFLPDNQRENRIVTHGLVGRDVHVPTHLFKVIFKHNRTTTQEVYILPNQTLPPKTPFTQYQYEPIAATNYIQQYSGILFNEWINKR